MAHTSSVCVLYVLRIPCAIPYAHTFAFYPTSRTRAQHQYSFACTQNTTPSHHHYVCTYKQSAALPMGRMRRNASFQWVGLCVCLYVYVCVCVMHHRAFSLRGPNNDAIHNTTSNGTTRGCVLVGYAANILRTHTFMLVFAHPLSLDGFLNVGLYGSVSVCEPFAVCVCAAEWCRNFETGH